MCVGPRKAMLDVLGSDEDALEAALGLGELAGLTVTNEADAYDVWSAVFNNMLYLVITMVSIIMSSLLSRCAVR